jgi:hypothetical protein
MKYSAEFYKDLKIGQTIYTLYNHKIYPTTIREIDFKYSLVNDEEKMSGIYIKSYNENIGYSSFYNDDAIYLNYEDFFKLFPPSYHSLYEKKSEKEYIQKLEKVLHRLCEHPDYQYESVCSTIHYDNIPSPEGEGWEVNSDLNDGFDIFSCYIRKHWRRRKK